MAVTYRGDCPHRLGDKKCIARRIDIEKGIEIEKMISVQEPEARGMNQENVSTNLNLSDNTP